MQLKELRLKAGKTQKEIAEYLNMSQTGYNSYEIGKSEPNIDVLKKLSRYYNKPIDYMVDNEMIYSVDYRETSPTQNEIMDEISKMEESKCEFILNFIRSLNSYEDLSKSKKNDREKG